MLTFTLQVVVTLLFAATGVAGLMVARQRSVTREAHRLTWWVAGTVFLLHGAAKLVQNSFGYWAMVAGPKSVTMARYLDWAPFFNHSRTGIWMAGCALLLYIALRKRDVSSHFRASAIGVLVATMFAAGFLGSWYDGALVAATHYTTVAVVDALELVLVLGTLFGLLVSNRADRYLWAALAAYGFMVALNVVWFAALSLLDDRSVWSPRPWHIHAYRAVLAVAIFALVARRLLLARRGRTVFGLLETRAAPAGALSF